MYLQGTTYSRPTGKCTLEPYVPKGTRTVLRGERNGNIRDLPD